ncbi:TIGR02677 family protein [Georgenia sp. AZ-5]|uniref:TIGR02677 family protein n=1 Tax=Georgenia sp. AZ-5 TaxID=3367526 RepID=UPI0037551F89
MSETARTGVPERPAQQQPARTDLFRYLTTDLAGEYRAIMGLFTGTLLADLSAAEVSAGLAGAGVVLSVDDVTARCEQLERWGNLVRGIRDARVATVHDYVRSRARYQASKLGVRVHREAEALLAAGDGAREVARELLGVTAETLERLTGRLRAATPARPADAEALSGDVTSVFNNQRLFSDSVRDFYAYVNTVLTRYDLAGEEYQQFKGLLLDYIDMLTADVAHHAPVVARRFSELAPYLDDLLAALATLPTLQAPDSRTERLPGRTREDWEQIRAWYVGTDGRSGPQTLRMAADQALGQLLANAKRMLAGAGTGVSRRADLLKLATWFDAAEPEDAHRLYAAAFGTFPSRHLLGGPEEPDPRDGATTSWWSATPVEVPISLRERGDRSARGRTASVPDPGLDRERLLAQAEEEADARATAVDELVTAGDLDGARLSRPALNLLLGRLTRLLGQHPQLDGPATSTDTDLGLELAARPDPAGRTVLHTPDGALTVHGLVLTAAPTAARQEVPA